HPLSGDVERARISRSTGRIPQVGLGMAVGVVEEDAGLPGEADIVAEVEAQPSLEVVLPLLLEPAGADDEYRRSRAVEVRERTSHRGSADGKARLGYRHVGEG